DEHGLLRDGGRARGGLGAGDRPVPPVLLREDQPAPGSRHRRPLVDLLARARPHDVDPRRVRPAAGEPQVRARGLQAGHRQPSSGAPWVSTASRTWALWSTPSWLGTVSSSVSAAAIASSSASSFTSLSGSPA